MHADFHAEAEVQSPGLDSKRFGCALHQAVQFGFCGAEGHRALCAWPMLNQVSAANGYATWCAASCGHAPNEIRVDKDVEIALWLPDEGLHDSWTAFQVPSQALQGLLTGLIW